MAEKSVDERLAEKQQELDELVREKQGKTFVEFPKSVVDPNDPSKSYTVQTAEQEAQVRKGFGASDHAGAGIAVGNTFELTAEEQDAQRLARAEADKDAASATSRLGGAVDEKAKAAKDKAKRNA